MLHGTSWLGVDDGQALRFFVERLRDVVGAQAPPETALLYSASVLAHFASTSTRSTTDFPTSPVSLSTVFDVYVLDRSRHTDPHIMEAAGAQCLLLTGFFQTQLRRCHNLDWFAGLGAGFYDSAAHLQRDAKRIRLLGHMSRHFGYWRDRYGRLASELRQEGQLFRQRRAESA